MPILTVSFFKKELQKAESLVAEGKYREAATIFESCSTFFKKKEQWELLIKANIGKSDCHLYLAQLDKAIAINEHNLGLIQEHLGTEHLYLSHCYSGLAQAYAYQSRYNQALHYLLKNLQFLQKHHPNERTQMAHAENGLGYVCKAIGSIDKAIEHYQNALHIHRTQDGENHPSTALMHNNISAAYYAKGNYQKSSQHLQKALNIRTQLLPQNHPDIAISLDNLAMCLSKMGDLENALHHRQKALKIKLIAYGEDHAETALTYNNLANIHHRKNDYLQALSYNEKALAIRVKKYGEQHQDTAISHQNIGAVYSDLKNYPKALEHLLKAQLIFEELFTPNHPRVARVLENIGNCYLEQKNYNQAFTFFDKALTINQEHFGEQNDNTALAWMGLGNVARMNGYFETALQLYQKALVGVFLTHNDDDILSVPVLESYSNPVAAFDVLYFKALTFKQLFQQTAQKQHLEAARIYAHVAIDLLDKLRRGYHSEASKLWWAAKTSAAFDLAIDAHLMDCPDLPADHEQAFTYSEKSKALLLLSSIKEANARLEIGLPTDILDKINEQQVELNYLQQQILEQQHPNTTTIDSRLSGLQSLYFDQLQAHETLIQQLEQDYPQYYELKYKVETIDLASLQAILPPQMALLEFFVGESHITIFSITTTHCKVIQKPKPTDFERTIRLFNKSIHQIRLSDYVKTAHHLYQILLEPSILFFKKNNPKTNPIEQLLIIPHGILSSIPFEAFLCNLPKTEGLAYADLDYLLLHFEVQYHYSATLWTYQQQQSTKKEDSFVGFAPVYLDEEDEVAKPIENGVRSVRIGRKTYGALLHSEKEVQGVQAAFKGKGIGAVSYLHEAATKSNFLKKVQGYKYILVAAHSFYNKQKPNLSGIIFSPENQQSPNETVLYVQDAYQLKLNADLVVLSSCESGIGKLAKGEGMMAINRGFLYAGAKHIIFTLFKVYDRESGLLTQYFFEAILDVQSYAAALRKAKMRLLREQDCHPKKWAGFVLLG